jgi:Ca2+-binding EF-hand superfamily protein
MQDVLGYVKDIFVEVSTDGNTIDLDGLHKAMKMLKGSSASEQEMKEIFNFSDLSENVLINLKEFVVALTLGVVLESINFGVEKVQLAPSPRRASISSFFGHPKEIYAMLSLIVSAYLLFDPNGEGMIHEEAVEKLLEESGHKHGNNAMLSHARWQELDWDSDGTIDLAEFVNAFTEWIDFEEQLSSAS